MRQRRLLLLAALLAALTGLRLLLATLLPLVPDEAYYWVWSHALAPGYLDAPPMIALWIRAGIWLGGQNAASVRLLGPLAAALGVVLLADAGRSLFPAHPRAGLRAALLLSATPLLGAGAVLATPDTPLLFFWTVTLWALAHVPQASSRHGGGWFLLAGLAGGCALDAKYTAAFLPVGALLWLLLTPSRRGWLARPAPWLAALLALAVFAPVIGWNLAHGGASFIKQGGRLADFDWGRAWQFEAELIGGQIGLASPLIWLLCLVGLIRAARAAWRGDAGATLLLCLTLPAALVFLEHASGDRVQGNWPAILYPGATLAAGMATGDGWRARLFAPALGLGAALTALVYAQALWGVLPVPPTRDPTALQMAGWPALARAIGARTNCVVARNYGLASELAFYAPPGLRVIAAAPRWALFRLPAGGCGADGMAVHRLHPSAPDSGSLIRRRGAAAVAAYGLSRAPTPIAPPARVLPLRHAPD
ncbi:MAG: glycosyltransferase family 39 protein [Rhodospirillales bacterium]|nr:glycosyltransferase family 39 protein [Rhodospirillales bacterium]